jgi:hypothetical protein
MSKRIFFVILVVLCTSIKLRAGDVYVVQGFALGPQLDSNFMILWTSDAFFYNAGLSESRVTLLHVSNGGSAPDPSGDVLLLPAHTSRSLIAAKSLWRTDTGAALWVLHLDAPADTLVDDTLFIGSQGINLPSPSTSRFRFGKARLPVFRSLIPAGQQQVHLATSLGPFSDNPAEVQTPSRLNVTVYNAATSAASALIEIRQHCDDRVITSRTVTIPADTIVQIGGFEGRTANCPPIGMSGDAERFVYTVVTVDQPSFSFVSNLSNAATPTTSISITDTQ